MFPPKIRDPVIDWDKELQKKLTPDQIKSVLIFFQLFTIAFANVKTTLSVCSIIVVLKYYLEAKQGGGGGRGGNGVLVVQQPATSA